MKKQMSREKLFITAFFLGAATVSLCVIIGIIVLQPSFGFNDDISAKTSSTVTTDAVTQKDETKHTAKPTSTTSSEPSESNKTIQIDDVLQRELNIYLSNFSEVGFNSFKNTPSKGEQVDFGIRHNYINIPDRVNDANLVVEETTCDKKIKFTYVAESVKKFLGITLEPSELKNYSFYRDGYIFFNSSNIKSNGFTIVNKLEAKDDNKYTVSFELYSDDGYDNTTPNSVMYKFSPSDAKELGIKSKGYSGTAIISAEDLYDRSTYITEYYVVFAD